MSKYPLSEADKKLLADQMDAAKVKRAEKARYRNALAAKNGKKKVSAPNKAKKSERKYKKTPRGKILVVDAPTPIPAKVRKSAKFVKGK